MNMGLEGRISPPQLAAVLSTMMTLPRLMGRSMAPCCWPAAQALLGHTSTLHVGACALQESAARPLQASPDETRSAWQPQQGRPQQQHPVQQAATEPSPAGADVDAVPAHPVLAEVHATLRAMGLDPGVDCIVADGLAEVPLALFLRGKQVAIELVPAAQGAGGEAAAASPAARARGFALQRVRERALQAHGWVLLHLHEHEWQQAGSDGPPPPAQGEEGPPSAAAWRQHQRMHLLLDRLKGLLQQEDGVHHHGHHHHNHGGGGGGGCGSCGCH